MRAADVELERMQLHARRIEQRTRKVRALPPPLCIWRLTACGLPFVRAQGQWGTTDDAEETVGSVAVRAAVATLCKSAGASVEALAAAYRAAFADLLDSLRAVPVSCVGQPRRLPVPPVPSSLDPCFPHTPRPRNHRDEALRDLLSRLDFNGFYARNAADAMA